jgi:hypothetical protein
MKFKDFELERWLATTPHKLDLGGGSMVKLRLRELLVNVDPELELSYGSTRGSEVVRQRIAELYPNVSADNVLVTTGTAEANLITLSVLLNRGDEGIVGAPTYMQYAGIMETLDVSIRQFHLREEMQYKPDLEELKSQISEKTKVIVLCNPNNPTGSIFSPREIQAVCELAKEINAYVLCDTALRGTEMDGVLSPTPLEFYDKSIVTGSLSKTGLPGLRIGWIIGERKFVDRCWAYKDYTTLSHSGLGEYLGAIALQKENRDRILKRAMQVAREHSTILAKWIDENGDLMGWIRPQGGHTAFPWYGIGMGSVEFGKRLAEEENVLVVPGDFFGVPKHVRVRYSCGRSTLEEGLNRLGNFLRRHN